MIIFLISNYAGINTGRGGHYYSLKQMVDAVGKHNDTAIIAVGTEMPPVFRDTKCAYFVGTSLLKEMEAVRKVTQLIEDLGISEKLKTIHAYDSGAAYVGLTLARKLNLGFFLTKCGGGLPRWYYPKVHSLIVFHEADEHYFRTKKTGYNNVYLIPNRVQKVQCSEERLASVVQRDTFTVVKIGRLSPYYYKTLCQSIALCSSLAEQGLKNRLLLIGYAESPELVKDLERIAASQSVEVKFLTDEAYTHNASELIWACDAAVGTGRGAMEVLSTGKILFFPVANSSYPCLFNEETSKYAMYENFSERVSLPSHLDKFCNPSYLTGILSNASYREDLKKYSAEVFHSIYDVDLGAKKLKELYCQAESNARSMSRWSVEEIRFYHLIIGLRRIFRLRKKKLKKIFNFSSN